MKSSAGVASDLLKSLAHPSRLMILCCLVEGERSVGDLAAFVGAREATVSQHLALLRAAGIVAPRREAQTIYYSIASRQAQAVVETLYGLYCHPDSGSGPVRKTKDTTGQSR